ncbi:MAG TPA: lactate utilization protein [Candidatus Sulfotelmatobacter sp.]|nr:lactate utilization protein [Candidatus Sulfotelmatobacter sp.]
MGEGLEMEMEMTLDFTSAAPATELEALAEKLRARNFEVVIVQDGAEAKAEVLKRIPEGAMVHSGKSKTLEDAGIFTEFMESGRYDFVRKATMKMDRNTQRDAMRKLGAAPDFMVNSAHAVTQDGQIVITSASGSQIGPIASGAGKLILVVGSQKIVPDLDAAFRRIKDYVFPYEDARLRETIGIGTKITRTLILEQDFMPGRTTIVLVREPIGV